MAYHCVAEPECCIVVVGGERFRIVECTAGLFGVARAGMSLEKSTLVAHGERLEFYEFVGEAYAGGEVIAAVGFVEYFIKQRWQE